MDITLRAARPADAPRLTEIAHAAKRYWRYPEDWIALWDQALTVGPQFIAGHPVTCLLVDGQVVGFYALSITGEQAELEHLWVAPPFIRRGLGRRLLEHACQTATAAGGTSLRIVSDPHAAGFYRRAGARHVGEASSLPAGRRLPVLVLPLKRDEP